MTDPTPRDRALAGEVVKVTDERLAEMQRIAIANEGIELYSMHWHWTCAINELIAARKEIERLRATLDAAGALADWINRARPTITGLMEAYVRLNRSYWTGDAIDRVQPWRCMEYIAAEDLLRNQPVAVVEITAKGTIPKSADTNADDGVQAESVRINSAAAASTMSRREMIAAMALQGLCAAITNYDGPCRVIDMDGIAKDALSFADALLQELAK